MLSILIIGIDVTTELSEVQRVVLYSLDLVICVVLVLEYGYRLRRSIDKLSFIKESWYELLAFIPIYLLSLIKVSAVGLVLRPLRLIRVFRLVRVALLVTRWLRFLRFMKVFLVRSKVLYLLVFALSIVIISSIAIYVSEYGLAIKSFLDALWWSITTITTVGYGDIVPTTVEGRIIGLALMFFGIVTWSALISLITVTLIEKPYQKPSLRQEIKQLTKKYIDKVEELDEEERKILKEILKLIS